MMPAHSDLTPLVLTLWVCNVLVDTGGQLAFKAAAINGKASSGWARWMKMTRRPWLWIGIGCYVAEFGLWLAFLSLVPLSEGVLLGTINTVAIMIAGRYLFSETLSRMRVTGILLISVGVAVVGWH